MERDIHETRAHTDAELLRRFRRHGDRQALAALLERHRGLAYRVALGILRSPADAEDAAQDALLHFLAYEPRVREEDSLAPLVARMAMRSAQHLGRAARRRRAREDVSGATEAAPPDAVWEAVAEREKRQVVRDAVACLDERYRLPVILCYFEGLSTREAAEALRISQSTVTTRLSRAVGKLRDRLRREGRLLPVPALLALLQPDDADAAPPTLAQRIGELASQAPAAGIRTPLIATALKARLAAVALVGLVSVGGFTALRHVPPPPDAGAAGRVSRANGVPSPDTAADRSNRYRTGDSEPAANRPIGRGTQRALLWTPAPGRLRRQGRQAGSHAEHPRPGAMHITGGRMWHAAGLPSASPTLATREAPAGQQRPPVHLAQAAPPAAEGSAPERAGVRGTVFDEGDRPLAGAAVTFRPAGGEERRTTTDAQGRYTFEGLPAGAFEVVAHKPGYTTQRQAVSTAREQRVYGISFRLRPWATVPWSVSGTVRREDGKTPLPGATVTLCWEPVPFGRTPLPSVITDEAGCFSFPDLRPGRYTLSVSAPGCYPWPAADFPLPESRFVLRPGDDHRSIDPVVIPASPGGAPVVQMRLLGPGRQPLANQAVRVSARGQALTTLVPWGDELHTRSVGWNGAVRFHNRIEGILPTDGTGQLRVCLPAGTYFLDIGPSRGAQPAPGVASADAGGISLFLPLGLGQTVTLPSFAIGGSAAVAAAPAQPAAPVQPATLRGVLLQPDGTPLRNSGAYVFAQAEGSVRSEGANYTQARNLPAAYVTTDAEGRFVRGPLQPGAVLVSAKTRRIAASAPMRADPPAGGSTEVVLKLAGPALTMAGRVVTPEGRPVPGAWVVAYRLDSRWSAEDVWRALACIGRVGDSGPWPADAPPQMLPAGTVPGMLANGVTYAETDADGRFTLAGLDPGPYVALAVAPGWTRSRLERVELEAGKAAPSLSLALALLGAVDAAFLQPDGKPLPNAPVRVTLVGQEGKEQRTRSGMAYTTAGGRCLLCGIEPGVWRLRAKAPGYPELDAGTVTVPVGATTRIGLRLEAGVTLQGRVLTPDGAASGGAVVRFKPLRMGEDAAEEGMAGRDGTFTLRGLSPGPGILQAYQAGLGPAELRFTVGAGMRQAADLRLLCTGTVKGCVRDGQGNPIPGATVSFRTAQPEDPEEGFYWHTLAGTDAEGRYTAVEVPAGKLQFRAWKEGWRTPPQSPGLERDLSRVTAECVVDLVLEPKQPHQTQTGSLSGRVLLADGQPAVGVILEPCFIEREGSTERSWFGTERAATDPQGAFRFERIAAGKGELTIRQDGGILPGVEVPFEVRPDAESTVPDIRLGSADLGTIEGHVKGVAGLPVDGCSVPYVSPAALAVSKEGSPLTPAQAQCLYLPGAPNVRHPAARPAGLADLLFFGPAGVAFAVYPKEARMLFTSFDEKSPDVGDIDLRSGDFRIGGLAPGRYHLQLTWMLPDNAGSVARRPVQTAVQAGKATRVELPMEPGGTAAGHLLGPDGKPSAGLVVALFRDTLQFAGIASIKEDGAFSLPGLAPGDYLAVVWMPGLAGLRQPFTVRAGETIPLDLRLTEGLALRGRVEGARPKELYLSAESDVGFGGARVAEDGTFAVEHLLPGTYTLSLWANGEAKVVGAPRVAVGPTGTKEVTLAWQP